MQRQRGVDRRVLAREPGVVDARAAPGPARGRAAVERGVNRRRRSGVADAHLAGRQKIDAADNRLHAIGQRRGGGGLLHRRSLREVLRRVLQRQFEHFQADAEALADLIDRRAAGGEIIEHLLGDAGRKGGDALRHDAVIGGEHRDDGHLDGRLRPALPRGEPLHDLLQPPQRAGRLGEPRVARPRGLDAFRARRRQVEQQQADFFERSDVLGHGLAVLDGRSGGDVLVWVVRIERFQERA